MPVYKCSSGKWRIGKDGECKYHSKQKAENAFDHWVETKEGVNEANEEGDVVSMDHSFLLRIMELMREDQSISDVKLHEIADKIIECGKEDTVTMDDYDYIAQGLDPEKAGYGSEYDEEETKEEVLVNPDNADDGDKGEIEDDPEHAGKHELDELESIRRLAGMHLDKRF